MASSVDERRDAPYGERPPEYRLPADTRVGRIRLQVADLGRSIDFYERVLGFSHRVTGNGTASLFASGDGTALIELTERPGATPVPRRGRLGLYHFAILLPDRVSLGQFVAHLGSVGVRPGASDHLVSEALYLQDPDGLGIEVYADRPRSSWKHRNRQLVMATEPLDLASLVAAGGGKPWPGMPAGTSIGHVHLHVGELDRAEEFYHRAIGFDKMVWSYPGALFLSAGGYHHHLGVNTWAAGASMAGEDDAKLIAWEMVVPAGTDVDEVAGSLSAAGYSAGREGRSLVVHDPWGTAVRILSP
jgi:catechol 2,3-dioxygenase